MINIKQRTLLIAFVGMVTLLSSCTITRNQQAEMTWTAPSGTDPISYISPDSSIVMEYTMWNENGSLETTVTNFSDSILIIDLKTSRFESNGFSRAYNNPDWMIAESKFDMTAGNVADYLFIDPRSSRTIKLFTLNAYLNLNYDKPNETKKDSLVYDFDASPLKATNHLIFAKGYSEWQSLDHSFYLNKITKWNKGEPVAMKNLGNKSRFYVQDKRVAGGILAVISLSLIVLFVVSGG